MSENIFKKVTKVKRVNGTVSLTHFSIDGSKLTFTIWLGYKSKLMLKGNPYQQS